MCKNHYSVSTSTVLEIELELIKNNFKTLRKIARNVKTTSFQTLKLYSGALIYFYFVHLQTDKTDGESMNRLSWAQRGKKSYLLKSAKLQSNPNPLLCREQKLWTNSGPKRVYKSVPNFKKIQLCMPSLI